ncbi:hypothetical protein LINPERHAP1_LOCUS13324, partial [Linum perenne]
KKSLPRSSKKSLPAANSSVGPPISSAAIPIDDIWTPEIQARCPSSEAPSRNSLPLLSISMVVAPLPSLSSFFSSFKSSLSLQERFLTLGSSQVQANQSLHPLRSSQRNIICWIFS